MLGRKELPTAVWTRGDGGEQMGDWEGWRRMPATRGPSVMRGQIGLSGAVEGSSSGAHGP
jgi:hypothetical protein